MAKPPESRLRRRLEARLQDLSNEQNDCVDEVSGDQSAKKRIALRGMRARIDAAKKAQKAEPEDKD